MHRTARRGTHGDTVPGAGDLRVDLDRVQRAIGAEKNEYAADLGDGDPLVAAQREGDDSCIRLGGSGSQAGAGARLREEGRPALGHGELRAGSIAVARRDAHAHLARDTFCARGCAEGLRGSRERRVVSSEQREQFGSLVGARRERGRERERRGNA